ncbi:MAG: hypothetical protein ACRET8_00550 [Burkholderiales bacterium]
MSTAQPSQEPESQREQMYGALLDIVRGTNWMRLRDIAFDEHWERKRQRSRNPLLGFGRKYFSQNEEDGILLEICRRIGLERGAFTELGVGDGLENNTLILLMHGWEGVWIGGEKLAFEVPAAGPLFFIEAWITRENCADLVSHGLSSIGCDVPQVMSVDLDGNDLYVLEALLGMGLRPDVVVAEYNAKFPPPVRWSVAYDPGLEWDGSDYVGASLQSIVDMLEKYGYRLVACNVTGANAFFVRDVHVPNFADVPEQIEELYMEADYNWFVHRGYAASPRTIGRFLERRRAKGKA